MITFREEEDKLIFSYTPYNETSWVYDKTDENEKVKLRRTFTFQKDDLYTRRSEYEDKDFDKEDTVEFIFGILIDEYYKVKADILEIEQDLYLHKDLPVEVEMFIASKNISIIGKMSKLIEGDIYIGGNDDNCLPAEEMQRLIKSFPNYYETQKYVDARISVVLRDYFDNVVDAKQKYDKYMNSKISAKGENLTDRFRESELHKYKAIYEKLTTMLDSENNYNEKQWQAEIIQIILLIFPKYLHAFDEVAITDTQNRSRPLDYLLVDSTGNIDIVEIKKPFNSSIVTKRTYRDNYIPMRELSGTVMQIEKYIFYLNKWGKKGEERLTEEFKEKIPQNFNIQITNPSGIIIMGREIGLSKEQLLDFEVIKRKYKNVVDIITYDDLLNRLRLMIEKLKGSN